MTSTNPDSMVGTRIGQFRLDEYISRGSMGLVFKAFDTVLERTVALKLIPKTADDLFPHGEEASRRFVQEARATAKLSNHPNIVTIYTSGETDEFQYICMEYVSGKSLFQILREEKLLSPERALPLFEQVLLAIHAAHQAEITHRDIKPSNIMITKEGEVRVVDFGIAKLASLSMTTVGSILGTPYYMSPEQISGSKVDSRSDIFSTGAVLYQVLTGERPFKGESTTALIYKIMNTEPVAPNVLNAHVPEPLCEIIRKAMAKSPADRYQDPAAMLQAIREVMKHRREAPQPDREAGGRPSRGAEPPPPGREKEIGGETKMVRLVESPPLQAEAAEAISHSAVTPPPFEEDFPDVPQAPETAETSVPPRKSTGTAWIFTLALTGLLVLGTGLYFFLSPRDFVKTGKKTDFPASTTTTSPPQVNLEKEPPQPPTPPAASEGATSKDAPTVLAEAWSLYKASKFEEAIPKFQAALGVAESAEAYKGLGQSYYRLRKYRDALDALLKFKELAPKSWEALHWVGWTYLRLQKPQEALPNLLESNKIKILAGNFSGIAWSHANLWDFDSATTAARKAIELEPANGDHYNAFAWIQYYQRKYAAASAQFEKAVSLGKKDDNLVGLMLCYHNLGRYNEAISNIDSYIAKGDAKGISLTDLKVILAYCHLANGNYESARQQLSGLSTGSSIGIWLQGKGGETGLRIHTVFKYSPAFFAPMVPGDTITRANGMDLRDKTSSDYWSYINKQLLGSRARLTFIHNGTSLETTFNAGITPELIAAIEKRKQDVKSHYERGNSLYAAKNFKGAVESYKQALAIEDAFALLYHNLAMAQLAVGQKKEAAANLESYLERRPDASNAKELRRIIQENAVP